jgi:hypothetical protein
MCWELGDRLSSRKNPIDDEIIVEGNNRVPVIEGNDLLLMECT